VAAAIALERLTKRYGQQVVVNRLSFEIEKGEIFGFLGPNGSGKTTTIKMLCGILEPSEGTGTINGFDLVRDIRKVKRSIGYMSQQFSLNRCLTVAQNLNFYASIFGLTGDQSRRRIANVLEVTGLAGQDNKRAASLSGGWKQRLALGCAIIHEPPVVFLDEPTAGIDPVARRSLWDLLVDLATTGVTFFVTTHYMDEAERCSSLGYIYNSNLIAIGKADVLRALPAVNRPHRKLLEVTCSHLLPAVRFFRCQDYVEDATLFGHTLHVVVSQHKSTEEIWKDLFSADLDVTEIRQIQPSLEDVFVTLTEREEARCTT